MVTSERLREILAYYTGSGTWWRCPLNPKMSYTDGARAFFTEAEAYWLLDLLSTQPEILKLAREGFANVLLRVSVGSTAVLTADDGNGEHAYVRKLAFTTCPEGEWRFYVTDNVILLPSEY